MTIKEIDVKHIITNTFTSIGNIAITVKRVLSRKVWMLVFSIVTHTRMFEEFCFTDISQIHINDYR